MVITTLANYIKEIERNCSRDADGYLFRGQLKIDKLKPKLFREGAEIELKKERTMLRDFKRKSQPYINIVPQSEYEWLALAQHHGMVTRLLDWTSNALAAIWFTVTDDRKSTKADGVVWRLSYDNAEIKHPKFDDIPFDIQKTEIFFPTHIDARFIAQGGWFTIHDNKESLNEDKKFKEKFVSITIPRNCFKNIRFSLNRCGVNNVSLFPDYMGLCRHLNWRYSNKYGKRDNAL